MEEKKKRKKLYRKSIEKRFLKKRFEFRLSEAELIELKTKAQEAGLNTSTYARKKVMDTKGSVFNPTELVQHFYRYTGAVNRVGNNINQATNYINYLKKERKTDEKAVLEFNQLFHDLVVLMTELNKVMNYQLKKLR